MQSISDRIVQSRQHDASTPELRTLRRLPRAAARVAVPLICAALGGAACAPAAIAQAIVPGINAPPLVSFPTPQAQVPAIPQPGVLPQQNLALPPSNSFPDRISACNRTGAASGLSGGLLDAYTRECVNQ